MKAVIFWIGTVVAFGATNGMIAHKESTIRNGTTMYLELEPRDPPIVDAGRLHGVALQFEQCV